MSTATIHTRRRFGPLHVRSFTGAFRLRRHGNHSEHIAATPDPDGPVTQDASEDRPSSPVYLKVTGEDTRPFGAVGQSGNPYPALGSWSRDEVWKRVNARLSDMPGEHQFAGASVAGLPLREWNPAHEERLAGLEKAAAEGGRFDTTVLDMPPARPRPFVPRRPSPAADGAKLPVYDRLMLEWPGLREQYKARHAVVALADEWQTWAGLFADVAAEAGTDVAA